MMPHFRLPNSVRGTAGAKKARKSLQDRNQVRWPFYANALLCVPLTSDRCYETFSTQRRKAHRHDPSISNGLKFNNFGHRTGRARIPVENSGALDPKNGC